MNKIAQTLVVAAVVLSAPATAVAQAYPSKPVRILVGFAAGGATDLTARMLAQKLAEISGQPFVVENRTGASGMIAADAVAKAAPDGHTLLVTTQSSHAVGPAFYGKSPYDPVRDFAPVTVLASSPLLLVVHPSVPAKSVGELIELARANPGRLGFGSAGNGSVLHLTTELFSSMSGVKLLHVPHKGEAPALTDMLGGRLSLMFANVPVAMPHVRGGKLRALAVTSASRLPNDGDYPTVAESGLAGFDVATWLYLFAPAGTPREVILKLNAESTRALYQPELRNKLAEQGLFAVANSPEQCADHLKTEIAKWAKVIRESGAKPD